MKEEIRLVEKPSRYHFNGPGREDEVQDKGPESGREGRVRCYLDSRTNSIMALVRQDGWKASKNQR